METSPRYISQRRRLFASVLLRLLAAAMYLSAVLLSFLLLLFSVLIAVQGTGRGTVALDSLTFDKVIASFTKLSSENIWFVIQIITSDSEILLLSLLSFLCSLSFLLCFLLI